MAKKEEVPPWDELSDDAKKRFLDRMERAIALDLEKLRKAAEEAAAAKKDDKK